MVGVEYRAASGRVDITPEVGGFLAGYGADRRSTGVNDPLWAQILLLDDGAESLALITLDSIGLTRPDVLRLRERVRADLHTHVIVSSTHTHAGPDVVGLWGPSLWRSGADAQYMERLYSNVVSAVRELKTRMVPVQLSVASAEAPFDWVRNLSEPELLDRLVTVAKFTNLQGEVVATLTNFACHPTILGPQNTLISADYLSGFYATMRASMPGEHLFLQGAIGGWVQPLQGDRSFELAGEIGDALARFSLDLLEKADLVPTPVTVVDVEVDLPLENHGFRLMIGLGVLQRDLFGGWLGIDAMRTSVAAVRLGNLTMATFPGEPSPYYSLQVRALAETGQVMVLGLAQDALGYILKPDYFDESTEYPHAEYLTSVSVGPEAGPKLLEAHQEMLPVGEEGSGPDAHASASSAP